MTVRLAYANQKGGVGKSTMTLQTAFYASSKNLKVLVVDMDGQGNTSAKLAGRQTIEELLPSITRSYQLFNADLEKVTPITCSQGIDLIPAKINDHDLYGQESVSMSKVLAPTKNLETIAGNYDLVIIDCPPSLGRLLTAGLIMADKVIMPLQVSGFAIDGVGGLFQVIETLKRSGKRNLEVAGILINSYNARSKQHKKAAEELRGKAGDLVMDSIISNRSPIDQATNEAKPIWKVTSGAARPARAEVIAAIEEIFTRIGINA